MSICVNKSHPEFRALVEQSGESSEFVAIKVADYFNTTGETDSMPTLEDIGLSKVNVVNYSLKAVNIIQNNLSIVNKWFTQLKNTPTFWSKLQQDLQVPKEQVNLLRESEGTTIEEKLASFAANYSYAVEINTAKDKTDYRFKDNAELADYGGNSGYEDFEYEGSKYTQRTELEFDGEEHTYFYKDDKKITKREFNETAKKLLPKIIDRNSSHYSNLTVPGGTNYTENEIATPAITPSIKGHAQFATDNGIGWFRSDEQTKEGTGRIDEWDDDKNQRTVQNFVGGEPTKTRRILEVQSDLFQKGRDKDNLINEYSEEYQNVDGNTIEEIIEKRKNIKSNQFLQLLNKDNNWVTFFVKSIIQDSAKKGYEKVLFPSGNTASKVEGHTTLEELKKQKEDRIKELEEKKKTASNNKPWLVSEITNNKKHYFNTEEEANEFRRTNGRENFYSAVPTSSLKDSLKNIEDINNEINQLKQELERVEKEGFGALKPIYSFYENNIKSILKKQGYNPVSIVDEYGNTWNQVDITADNLKGILLNKMSAKNIPVTVAENSSEIENITKKWLALAGIKFEEVDQVVGRNGDPIDAFGKADLLNKVVQVVRGDMGKQALPEEAAHMLVQILKENGNPLYGAMLKKVPSLPIYKQVFEDYSDVYGGDTLKIAEEAMGKIIGNNLKGGDIENAWFERVWNWVKSTFKKMFGISSDLAPFMEASNIILRGENVGELIGTDAEYYKLNSNPDKQAAVIKTLEGLSSELIGKTEGGLYKTKSGKVIGSRVTNLVQMYRMRAIKDSTFTQDDAYINYMAKRGTVNHLFNQAIMNDLETGGVKPMEHYISVVKAEIDKSPEFEKGSNLYNISRESFRGLVNGVTHLHTHIKQKDPGAKIITEQVVANRELNLAGTIDVLVVHSDGSASIYDYKTKNFKPVLDENKKVITYHGIGEFTEDLYSEQISHYKNILKDLGVSVFRETRIIPIHAPFKWDYQNSKATPSAPVDMWIPEYGKEKDYLNHLPVSGEKTDYKAANEMLEKMFLAKARIKQALKKDYDNPKAKAHLDRLNKAIKRIQLDTDITGTFEDLQAAFKTIDSDVSRQDLSISEIKDLLDYLGLYSNISSVYMETAKELASDLTDAEMKQLRLKCMSYSTAIQTRTDILNREIIERLDQMGSEAVEIDPQTGDIKVKDAIEQGFLGSLFNGMGDISNPIFQDARKAVAVAAEHRKIQFEEKRAKLTELDSKFSSAASLLGYSGINTYDLMYNEAGDGLTTKLDKKFYEDRKLAYKTKNLHWFKEYTYFDKEGFEKFKADKLAAINNPENAYTEADKKRELAYINGLDVESDFEKIANPKNKFVKPKPDIDYKDYINKKWKTIQDNADLKGLYDFWVDFIAEMKEQDSSIANNFIPKIRMSMLESVGKLGIDALSIAGGKGALKNALTVRQQDSMVGAINDDGTPDFRVPLLYTDNVREPLSSKEHQDVVEAAINKYKKAFDTKLSDDAIQNTHEFNTLLKSEVEYAEIKKGKKMVSKDFSSTAMLMMDSFYNYKHMKSVEERILALKSLFAAQNTVVTDKFGRKVENPITKEWRNKLGVSTDEELFDKLTNAIIYGQRVQSKDSTVEVFGQNISMNKALGTANQYMTALSLALSPVLATSNYLGGKFNAYYTGKEGVFYTGKQLMEADKKITTRDKDTYAIIDYFLPYGRTKTSEFALGVSKASMIEKGTSTDNLLTLHNIGDDNVDESVFVAMMDNWVIDSDGQLKSKGSKTYKLKDQNAKTVREHFSVVDGKVKTTLSVEQQAQFRSIVNKAINSIKGTVTNDSLAAINTTILGQLLIKFRTWMPGVIRARWKDTGVDLITNEVDIGRFRVVTQEMFSSVPGMIKTMTQLSAEVGTFGVYKQKPNPEICKKYYEKFLSENPSIDRNEFTLDNYIEMRKQKLGALANELRMFILVGSLVASIMQGMGWDDEDESNVITYNLYRASQRTGLELGFFFSPSNVTEILKSPIPLMRVATGFGKVIDNTFDETRDRIFGENSKHDSSGLFHYTAKQIPIVNSVNSTLKNIVDLIDDDKSMEELLLGE